MAWIMDDINNERTMALIKTIDYWSFTQRTLNPKPLDST